VTIDCHRSKVQKYRRGLFFCAWDLVGPSGQGIWQNKQYTCRSQWPRGLMRRSAASRLLRLWVRFPPGAWMFVCCECIVLSGRGLWDGLITRPEKSYRLWCVVMCDLGTSRMRRPCPTGGCRAKNKQTIYLTENLVTILFCSYRCNLFFYRNLYVICSPKRVRKKYDEIYVLQF